MRNKTLTRIIIATLLCALLVNAGRATRVSALAVGPLADPVYDTELFAFKDYVEQNLDAPQLDTMFFLIGGLAVAQMGAQDALLISPYPNEENVKEWIINCGIQLYNSVIGLVPEGDYYVGIPSIGTGGVKGIPRQTIKALVAQMMGDAVVAINYPDLDTFLEENPNELYIPFNKDLQLGVNAIFGLSGGLDDWQKRHMNIGEVQNVTWNTQGLSESTIASFWSYIGLRGVRMNLAAPSSANIISGILGDADENIRLKDYQNIFINTYEHKVYVVKDNGTPQTYSSYPEPIVFRSSRDGIRYDATYWFGLQYMTQSYPSSLTTVKQILEYYFTLVNINNTSSAVPLYEDFINHIYVGVDWAGRREVDITDDMNLEMQNIPYYQQVTNDYLLDIRGLISDLVGVTDIFNQIKENLYDLTGILQINPDFTHISIDLPDISLLADPPIPVELNDFALYTENDYLEEIRDRSEKFGETIGEYFVFWHNADPVTVYVIFGSVIVILLGAFVGKLGHS